MTREEAREILATWLVSSKGAKGQRGYIEGWFDEEDAEAFHMAIEALSAEAVQGWIPVSERLPEEDGWYLVTVRGYETVTDVSLYSADGSAWGDVSTKQKVIAWMPLPEPYKGGDDE